MAQERTRTSDPLDDTFSRSTSPLDVGGGLANPPAIMPGQQGDVAVNIFGNVITAQKVTVRRNVDHVLQRMFALAARMGDKYYYSIPFRKKNKQTGEVTTERVEGETIVLANDLAREWGNCALETRVVDQGGFWMFYSRFTDYETGYNLTRGYQQRKGQDTGMRDQGRALDQVFQIGQSKSQRNAVVNALQSIAHEVFLEAKKGLRKRIEEKPEVAREWIKGKFAELKVDQKRVEEIYGRSAANWTIGDMAQIFAEIRSITEGIASVIDVYPPKDAMESDPGKGEAEPANKTTPKPEAEGSVFKPRQVVDPHLNVLFETESPATVGQELTHHNKVWRVAEVTADKVHVEFVKDLTMPAVPAAEKGQAAAAETTAAPKAKKAKGATPPPAAAVSPQAPAAAPAAGKPLFED